MSLGRRKVGIDEPSRWVFNRMADVYEARPAYPSALVDAVVQLAVGPVPGGDIRRRVLDVGAGTGHLALPLAERGLAVVALEPAQAMLERLRAAAASRSLALDACHASAERVPLPDSSIDLAVVSDALHFLDAELTARELDRLLTVQGRLAIVTCEWGPTPFMRELVRLIEAAVPRRPRRLQRQMVQISALTKIPLREVGTFHDETPMDHRTLDMVLRSISFIGPAMNAERRAEFRARVHALTAEPIWARTFVLRAGQR